ncbi:putative dynamin GTPase [Aspergillus candidus]|uniref:P-loop containing nucleoside triphosphate hydrolase protein n=1 Tax=Aspergillus candidus TaxID=41067 RepID=A0A2I2FEP8_ASPCN|nr:P-loop containing nucleoside triphosphate hydrolase protein [Aspergillus candidus]PLB39122.1 P-loop containing nucleoside triphosphate hydrolase protein [Aspergillus candidus]
MQADETQAINQLQSEQSRLLDKIDELRTIGVGGLVELPQLVVVGAQSSGKSSVLEAVSRVSFPTKSNVCTRFATEVVLRRSSTVRLKVLIEPGASRTDAEERQRIRDFTPDSFSNTGDLPDLIEQAKTRMGITDSMHGFSDDVLKVEISGPDKPELTLVDLPGLYISESEEQGAEGIRIVRELTERYMENNRSIILAVISAKVDYHLQNVLNIAKQFDPKRERTMGIITQPDRLERDSEEEENYIRYVRNEKVPLNLGWHALKNRSYEDRMASHDVRDEQERTFFNQGRWASLSREFVGVDSLRRRLSNVLLKHVRRNLPGLIADIQRQIEVRQKHLERLGPARSSAQEQRGYLLAICSSFERIVGQALNGGYAGDFFGGFNGLGNDPNNSQDFRRLRAIVRELNECFAEAMEMRGHRRCIVGTTHDAPTADSKVLSQPYMEGWTPIKISRTKMESEVSDQAKKDRGIEMPGSANHLLVGSLFRDQSQPWEMLARQHLLQCWESVRYFVGLILQHLTDEHTHSLLYGTHFSPELEKMKAHLMEKLNELTSHTKRGHPLPVGPSFLARIQRSRAKRQLSSLKSGLGLNLKTGDDKLTIHDLTRAFSTMDLSRDQFAAADIIDQMQAYYDTAIITFVDNIATLAVENCLLVPLERIFTNQTVNMMDENQLEDLAAEPPFVREDRCRLTDELGKLQAGLQTFSVLGTEPRSMSRPPAFPSRPPNSPPASKPEFTFSMAHEENNHPCKRARHG